MANLGNTLKLESISHYGPQLHMLYSFSGGLKFSTTIWYPFPLEDLDKGPTASLAEEVYLHCALFEMNKLCSLSPSLEYIDLGEWSRYLTEELEELWRYLTVKAFGEWRYLNNLPDWDGPKFCKPEHTGQGKVPAISVASQFDGVQCLAFCGGGKDSLTSMKLMEDIGEPFHSLSYSHSIYGQSSPQHDLTDSLIRHTASKHHHRMTTLDTFLSSPLPDALEYDGVTVNKVQAAETPSSIFEAIPIALRYGYTLFCLAHERSANTGNLVWDVNGEEINHQWLKGSKGQHLIAKYIKKNLVSNLSFFSSLMPIHDTLIFRFLTLHTSAVPFTHSCNIRKPWCLRCPKCCYVWLGYSAYLPEATVHATFGEENVLDVEENQVFFFEMLGLGKQTPFECIGQVEEVRLAFALCHTKGIRGKAMEMFEDKVRAQFEVDKSDIIASFAKVYTDDNYIPSSIADRLIKRLKEVSANAPDDIMKMLL